MLITKISKQKMEVLKAKQEDLYNSLISFLPESVLTLHIDELRGIVAGLIIEYVIKSGGNPVIFEEILLSVDDEDEYI